MTVKVSHRRVGNGVYRGEQAAKRISLTGRRREIVLYHGARREAGLYDLGALRQLELNYPWLQVIPVVSEEAAPDAIFGSVPDVVGLSSWRNRDIYVAGPDAMIARTVSELKDRGAPAERIHYDCPVL